MTPLVNKTNPFCAKIDHKIARRISHVAQKKTMKKTILYILLSFLLIGTSQAQDAYVPVPGAAPEGSTILYGGTAHIGNGKVIKNSLITLEDGKIKNISTSTVPPKAGNVINIKGKHVYPGLIAVNTTLGLSEIGAVRATRDYQEVGQLNPNIRSIIAYNTDSKVTPTVRSNGVLLAQVVPQGGRISGQSSIVNLDAWNYEDATYKADDGIYLSWPAMYTFKGWWAEPGGVEKNKNYDKALDEIRELFTQAIAYCNNDAPSTTNLKLAAMCGLFDNSKKLFVRANSAKEIIAAVNFLKQYDIQLAIVGARDAWMVTDLLRENNVAVVLNKTHNLPRYADDDIDLPFKMPKMLQDAGVLYCISVGAGWDGFWDQRNLAFEAGTAAAYGLTAEEALASITSNAARILGIDKQVGTLEAGKDATLIISEGDLLDMRTSNIEMAYIQGRLMNTDNKQKQLYRKFMKKYGLDPSPKQ